MSRRTLILCYFPNVTKFHTHVKQIGYSFTCFILYVSDLKLENIFKIVSKDGKQHRILHDDVTEIYFFSSKKVVSRKPVVNKTKNVFLLR
jgi:hypothetical protein